MGAFKPLLPFGNKTVIESCIDYLHEGGIENIVAVLGPRANEVCERLKGVTVAINPDPDSEMGASIAVGIQAVSQSTKAVDRKSTRLNSSHSQISYAVFCLKKKKKKKKNRIK